jgi:predicted dehydrogenase
MTPEDARRIRERVKESGIAFMAELPRRLAPATLRLKELIATQLGAPRLLFSHRRLPVLEARDQRLGCLNHRSTAQDLAELVDWSCYVVGRKPDWVTGVMSQATSGGCDQDYQMMSLDFSADAPPGTGPVAQISCGRYIPARWSEAITYRPLAAFQVRCEHGIAFIDLPSTLIWFDEAGRHQESLESERPVGEQLLMQFYRAVTSLVSKTCDVDDACLAVSIVERAWQSHHEGLRIKL